MISNKIYDVIVVGAGPAGSIAAETCANRGLKTLLVERSGVLGTKVCAGGLSPRVLRNFHVGEEVIDLYISNTLIFHRKQPIQETSYFGATVYRQKFDTYLADRAKAAGAELHTSTSCSEVVEGKNASQVFLRTPIGEGKIEGKVIVVANGFASKIASKNIIDRWGRQDVYLAAQYEFVTDFSTLENTLYIFYDEEWSKLGYSWIFPKRKGYTIGTMCLLSHTTGGELINNLNKFMLYLKKKFANMRKLNRGRLQVCCIPAKPRFSLHRRGMAFVGDSAGHVSPISSEGIFYAMVAGKMASDGIAEVLSNKRERSSIELSQYEKEWKNSYGKELHQQRRALELLMHMQNPIMAMAEVIEAGELVAPGILSRYNGLGRNLETINK